MNRRLVLLTLSALALIIVGVILWSGSTRREGEGGPIAEAVGQTAAPARPLVLSGAPQDGSPEAQRRRERYGVGVVDGDPEQVLALGLSWFTHIRGLDFVPPEGTNTPRFLPISPRMGEARVRETIARYPGGYWLIGNEPNVMDSSPAGLGNASPEVYAASLNFYATVIKDADPTATLIGPNVLNWSDTCNGCPGYPQGLEWTDRMRAVFVEQFGAEPPLDVWSLHTYELDWFSLPMGNAELHIRQITGMREWLDAIPDLAGKPIWITEQGIHWGYGGMEWQGDVAHPVGDYQFEHVERFMRELYGWLNENAEPLNIQKWFLFPISTTIFEPYQSQWAGITLLDGPAADAPINRLGEVYMELAGVR
jgi:hypothetical protein